jgi:uncharacterized protein involved in outer membrane biogenesis
VHRAAFFRAALRTAGAAALLVLAGALALHALVDPDRLKRVARDKAQAAWSRNLAIGEISLELFPLPALFATDVALGNPSWSKWPNLLTAERVTARLELLPLLAGEARVKRLDLDGVRLQLEVAPDGAKSWEMAPAKPSAKGGASGDSQLLNLRTVRIHNADILYRPQKGAVAPLHIEEATADGQPGLRDVRIVANAARGKRWVQIDAEFADLSRWGVPRASSQARIDADWGDTQVAIVGRIPLSASVAGHEVRVDLKSAALNDMLSFFGIEQRRTAAAEAHFESRGTQDVVEITRLNAALGKFNFTGVAKVTLSAAKPVIEGRIGTERLDWARVQLDAGEPPVAPLPPLEMFYTVPLGWDLLEALQGTRGIVDARVGSLLLRNGLQLHNFNARLKFDDDRLTVDPFSTDMLGGSASGTLYLEGRKKSARLKFDGTNLLLERWFRERGSQIAFTGGPMKIAASVSGSGHSMKSLAASMTGPVTIRMGHGVLASQKAGQAEAAMVGLAPGLAEKGAARIEFECATAVLPFAAGRAVAEPIVGVRTAASHLLTAGVVDFRDQSFDLRGRLKAKAGVTLGFAAIAGDVKISGKIREPSMTLDPVGTPGAIARGVAAVATLGLSVLGTGLVEAAQAKKDPCELKK